jgi:hypothetical protein
MAASPRPAYKVSSLCFTGQACFFLPKIHAIARPLVRLCPSQLSFFTSLIFASKSSRSDVSPEPQ